MQTEVLERDLTRQGNDFYRWCSETGSKENSDWESMGEFLKAVKRSRSGDKDSRLVRGKAMGTSSDSAGGFLVPSEHSAMIFWKALEDAIVMSRATVLPMSSDTLEIPYIDESSRASSLMGGVCCYWIGETDTKTPTDLSFGKLALHSHELVGFAKVYDRLLEDSTPAADQIIRQMFSSALQWYLDEAFLVGSGVAQPLGIFNSPCLIAAAAEPGQGTDTLVFSNVLHMYERLPAASRGKAVWVCGQDTFSQVYGLHQTLGTAGSSVMLVDGKSYPALPQSIFARPILWSEKLQTLGDEGDILVADFSQYVVGMRKSLTVEASRDFYFNEDATAYRFIVRCDGAPWWASALTPRNGTTTVSPFVTLEAR